MALKKKLGHSTAWMSAAAGGNSIVSFCIFIFLSRILTPEQIGLVAFALIFVEIGKIIVNAGFPQAIVQYAVWDQAYASTCFFINTVFAVSLTALVYFGGAYLVVNFYDPDAGPILKVLCVIYFIEGIKAVHEGKLKREFAFQVIALRTLIGGLLSGAVGIYLAVKGYGVWALVWQQIINHSIITLMTLWSSKWMPSLTFSWAYARQLIGFSSPLMFSQLIGNISSKIFELFMGIFIGPAALGFFRVGSRALFILQEMLLKPFEQTVLSALSRIPDRPHQAASTLRVIRMSAYLTLPIFFGAAAIGPEFIGFAFGEKWELSGQIMTILSFGIAPLVFGYQINAALMASGNTKMVMKQSAFNLVLNCALAAASAPLGLLVAAVGFSLRNYLSVYLNLYFFRRVFNQSMTSVLKAVAPSFISSLLMFASVMIIKFYFLKTVPVLLSLCICSLLGAVIYGGLMITLFRSETRNFFHESSDMLPQKLKPAVASIQRLIRLA